MMLACSGFDATIEQSFHEKIDYSAYPKMDCPPDAYTQAAWQTKACELRPDPALTL
jgi:hypothetical protein